jgi:hypothetical protein
MLKGLSGIQNENTIGTKQSLDRMENIYHGYFLLPHKFSSGQLNIWNTTANETRDAIMPSWYFDIPDAKQKKVKYIPVGPRNVP